MATRTYRDLYPTRDRWNDPVWFDLYADLTEEDDDNPGCCNAYDGAGYGCTREPNHSGPRVADDGDGVLAVWEDNNRPEDPNPDRNNDCGGELL